ncbi:ArnT family glycosyltransferase [Granulicella cerasi]|uniref:ArnT family glycosyltransferase n=1 Tax=Granulicella cerasi TaxID=741063 RepID=UPI0037C13472
MGLNPSTDRAGTLARRLSYLLLAASAVLFLLHFLHLGADFPNNSPWVDWSKYTDEGWYGDAAIRHFLFGHWYWKGDFNPATALPVWPAVELLPFKLFGVSPIVARATTLCVFAATLIAFYILLRRFARLHRKDGGPSLAPAFCVFLMCASPFFFVFERMAILEPLLILLTTLAMLAASSMHRCRAPGVPLRQRLLPALALGVLLPLMVLTKTTGLFLVPALAYMVWARAGYRWRHALEMGIPPALLGLALWLAYFVGYVRPRYLEDYRYLFSANAYTGILLEPFDKVVLNTFADGMWMGRVIYPAFFIVLALIIFWRPQLFRNPLKPALLLWATGYVLFLGYHNNLQPRYYLVVAAPVFAFVAMGLDSFRYEFSVRREYAATIVMTVLALGISLPGMKYMLHIATHPTFEFRDAANEVARIVRAEPNHSRLILSISGSDITLMTGLPSIDDDFGTLDLAERVKLYRPGWYVAWNELDDDKMDALTPLYNPVRVAAIPALDDNDRNLLIVYRLDPAPEKTPTPPVHKRKSTPKPLQTKVGQQPTTTQLKH